MTKQDIIRAASIVWGKALYKKMNLTEVAKYLGVTKPALYRHFSSKEALLDGLYKDFFDRYAAFLEQVLPVVQKKAALQDQVVYVAKNMADYFIKNKYDFIFFLNLVIGQEKPGRILKQELKLRGIQIEELDAFCGKKESLSLLQMVSVTVVFSVALFHFERMHMVDEVSEEAAAVAAENVADLVLEGFCSSHVLCNMPDFPSLDRAFSELQNRLQQDVPNRGVASAQLLDAVARAIAEVGPWEASMEFVAKKAGLSKSGLYAHFASKEEMFRQLFLNEFDALADLLEQALTLSADAMAQLYLTMRSAADYLRIHRDILLVMDWVRLQRIDLGILIPERGLTLFSFTKALPLRPYLKNWDNLTLASWILFFVVNQLMVEMRLGIDETDSQQNLHDLFTYMTTGVKGWKK